MTNAVNNELKQLGLWFRVNKLSLNVNKMIILCGRVRKLFLLQKEAIQIIDNINYRDHTSVFFHSSKILKLHDLVTHKTMIILYNANNHYLNGRVQAFFKPTAATHTYGTRQSKLFYVKKQTPPSDYCHSLSKWTVEQFNK